MKTVNACGGWKKRAGGVRMTVLLSAILCAVLFCGNARADEYEKLVARIERHFADAAARQKDMQSRIEDLDSLVAKLKEEIVSKDSELKKRGEECKASLKAAEEKALEFEERMKGLAGKDKNYDEEIVRLTTKLKLERKVSQEYQKRLSQERELREALEKEIRTLSPSSVVRPLAPAEESAE